MTRVTGTKLASSMASMASMASIMLVCRAKLIERQKADEKMNSKKKIETIPSALMTRREQLRLLALGHRYQYVGAMLVAVGGVADCTFVQSERGFSTRSEAEAYVARFTSADAEQADVSVYGPAKLAGTRVATMLAYNTL